MNYEAVADLPLRIDAVDLDRRDRDTSSGFTRATTVLSLSGAGETGCGEDVTYETDEHDPARWQQLDLSITGEYTFGAFSETLADCALFPAAPDRPVFREYRRWGFESAALDLALRQAGTTLGERLDRSYDPVRFVVSTRLREEESDDRLTAERIHSWLDWDPTLRFKLDPTPEWREELVAELAATGAVRTLDFKGHYEGTQVETPPDETLYESILDSFPEAILEDPALTPETRPLFEDHEAQVSWDAPIHGVDDIESLPFEPSWLNIKPSRFGTVESLLETLAYCRDRGIRMYGGGQFELGVGRTHIQVLASLFYPDAPNDVAPRGYNDPEPPATLPASPLAPPAKQRGLSWRG